MNNNLNKLEKLVNEKPVICQSNCSEDEILESFENLLEEKGIKIKSIDFIEDNDHIEIILNDGTYRVIELINNGSIRANNLYEN